MSQGAMSAQNLSFFKTTEEFEKKIIWKEIQARFAAHQSKNATWTPDTSGDMGQSPNLTHNPC